MATDAVTAASDATDTGSLLKNAVSEVLTDEGFTQIQSSTSQNAVQAAKELLGWCSICEFLSSGCVRQCFAGYFREGIES